MNNSRSNLEFRSNLQPITDDNWSRVWGKIIDPFALKILKAKQIYITPAQQDQYQYASEHCSYAFKDDYPWGTVRLDDGREVPVCKCLNTSCSDFKKCRPDFDPAELLIFVENQNESTHTVVFRALSDNEAVEEYHQETLNALQLESDLPEMTVTVIKEELPPSAVPVSAAVLAAEKGSDAETMPGDVPGHKDHEAELISKDQAESGRGFADTRELVTEPESFKVNVLKSNEKTEQEDDISTKSVPDAEMAYNSEAESVNDNTASGSQEQDRVHEVVDTAGRESGFRKFRVVPQQTVVSAPCIARAVVNAGPGTGKTWTLVERIVDLVYRQEADPENIMILCFSRAAVEVIEQRLKEAAAAGKIGYEYHNLMIRTFDSFATYLISWVMENCPELLPDGYSFEGQGYDARILTAISIMNQKPDIVEMYEHLIVDEVQDLVGYRAQLVLALLSILTDECGFTLLGDSCQAIYDWQAVSDPSLISSEKFYQELFEKWPEINYWSFDVNHRQSGDLAQLAVPYRDAILTGSKEDRNNVLSQILSGLRRASVNLLDLGDDELAQFTEDGTLGILTRTNAQALKISELLCNADIEHVVEKRAEQTELADWIARVFCEYPNETVNEALFTPYFIQTCGDDAMGRVHNAWSALVSTQYGEMKSRYQVEDLLDGVLRRGKAGELFSSAGSDARITVSNIHRAKGREFDSVLILEDLLSPLEKDEDDLLEHKVRYVAITRPRKVLDGISLKPQYIYSDRKTRRCFQAGFSRVKKGARYLSNIEVGLPGDVDIMSFADDEKAQNYIRNTLRPGMRVKFLKSRDFTGSNWVRYRIVLEDNENIVIGYTGRAFSDGIQRALKRIWERNKEVSVEYYPNTFGDIYVSNMITCISAAGVSLKAAKTFGSLAVWEGYSLRGLARYEKDKY